MFGSQNAFGSHLDILMKNVNMIPGTIFYIILS